MRNKEYWKEWFKKAGIRAVKTFAQTCGSLVPVGIMITEVNWTMVLGTGALAAVLSFCTSLAGIPEVKGEE